MSITGRGRSSRGQKSAAAKGPAMASRNGYFLIAPCGMNCGVCLAFLREKNKCPGCRGTDAGKPPTRAGCKIKNCEVFGESAAKFCFECAAFPCDKLKRLDKRYRAKYGMSMIENLGNIKSSGIGKFLKEEKARWSCSRCGGTICVHKRRCLDCA